MALLQISQRLYSVSIKSRLFRGLFAQNEFAHLPIVWNCAGSAQIENLTSYFQENFQRFICIATTCAAEKFYALIDFRDLTKGQNRDAPAIFDRRRSAYRMAVRNAWLRRSVLRRRKLLFEQEQTSGSCLGAGEAEDTETLPSKATETMNHTFRLVAATLCHAKLFSTLAG